MDGPLSSRSRRVARGAATVEAAIMLPVFLLMLLAVRHFQRAYVAKLQATASARACAVAYASHGCDEVPAGCEAAPRSSSAPTPESMAERIDDAASRALDAASRISSDFGSVATFPIIGALVDNFYGARATAEVERAFFGHLPGDARERRVSGRYVLACNVPRREGGDVAEELFEAMTNGD